MTPISGIYAICNHATGDVYVGRSLDIGKRWRGHLATLRKGCHGNKAFQQAVNATGTQTLGLVILERIEPERGTLHSNQLLSFFALYDREEHWIARARAAGISLYNDRVRQGRPPLDRAA